MASKPMSDRAYAMRWLRRDIELFSGSRETFPDLFAAYVYLARGLHEDEPSFLGWWFKAGFGRIAEGEAVNTLIAEGEIVAEKYSWFTTPELGFRKRDHWRPSPEQLGRLRSAEREVRELTEIVNRTEAPKNEDEDEAPEAEQDA